MNISLKKIKYDPVTTHEKCNDALFGSLGIKFRQEEETPTSAHWFPGRCFIGAIFRPFRHN
tara:strand:+ start:466 stop:648 length:183 start_codon:yes stop_codon:yes gene_type:complete